MGTIDMQHEVVQHESGVNGDWVAVHWPEDENTTRTTSLVRTDSLCVRTDSLLRTPDLSTPRTPEFTTPRYGGILFEPEKAPAAQHVSGQVREECAILRVSDKDLDSGQLALNQSCIVPIREADRANKYPSEPAGESDPVAAADSALAGGQGLCRNRFESVVNSTSYHPLEAPKLSTDPTQPLSPLPQGSCKEQDEESHIEPSDEAKVAIAGGTVAIAVVATTVTIIATGGAAAPAAALLLIA